MTHAPIDSCTITTEWVDYYHGLSQISPDVWDHPETIDRVQHNYQQLINGAPINQSENRAVTHLKCREAPLDASIHAFIDQVHNHQCRVNLLPISAICHVGIGGSITGIQWSCHAL